MANPTESNETGGAVLNGIVGVGAAVLTDELVALTVLEPVAGLAAAAVGGGVVFALDHLVESHVAQATDGHVEGARLGPDEGGARHSQDPMLISADHGRDVLSLPKHDQLLSADPETQAYSRAADPAHHNVHDLSVGESAPALDSDHIAQLQMASGDPGYWIEPNGISGQGFAPSPLPTLIADCGGYVTGHEWHHPQEQVLIHERGVIYDPADINDSSAV